MNNFIVIGLGGKPIGCQIIPEQASYTMNYGIVFGPDSLPHCKNWLENNCSTNVAPLQLFVVIAPIAGVEPCKVIGENEMFPMTHTLVFGPASKEECEDWIKNSCQ